MVPVFIPEINPLVCELSVPANVAFHSPISEIVPSFSPISPVSGLNDVLNVRFESTWPPPKIEPLNGPKLPKVVADGAALIGIKPWLPQISLSWDVPDILMFWLNA